MAAQRDRFGSLNETADKRESVVAGSEEALIVNRIENDGSHLTRVPGQVKKRLACLRVPSFHGAVVAAVTPPAQADLAWGLGADVVIPEGASATQSIQAVRDIFGGGGDTAIHIAGDLSVAAGVVRRGGRFTAVSDTTTAATRSDVNYVPSIVAPNGHKLADLLFKVAAHRLRSQVYRTLSFDQVADAVNPRSNNTDGRIVLVR